METNKQTKSENRASQQIDQGLLTFAISNKKNFVTSNITYETNKCVDK